MKRIINRENILWVIGVLQPVSPDEIVEYLKIILDAEVVTFDSDVISSFCLSQERTGHVIRVARKPDLYSLTAHGNSYLSRPHRISRDQARLFLLKKARRSRIWVSREESASGLGGDSPSSDTRSTLKGREANNIGPVVPSGQCYWPRFSKQLIDGTGLSQPSRDDPHLLLLSFASPRQLALALGRLESDLCLDVNSIGLMLGISPGLITKIPYNYSKFYRSFPLAKKGGGTRTIESPRTFLKVLQQFLADYFLNGLPVHDLVQSYRQNRSIISNASAHCNRKFVGNIDISNYFGSITEAGVFKLLKESSFDVVSARTVSKICSKNGILPQGAPTSPAISNAYLYEFDQAITEQCDARSLTYTRYADDITISGDDRSQIQSMIEWAGMYLNGEYGLELNKEKTRIASYTGQQKVTGVVVNEAPRPPRKLRRQVRAAFYNAMKAETLSSDDVRKLAGYLSYLKAFEKLRDAPEIQQYTSNLQKLRKRVSLALSSTKY